MSLVHRQRGDYRVNRWDWFLRLLKLLGWLFFRNFYERGISVLEEHIFSLSCITSLLDSWSLFEFEIWGLFILDLLRFDVIFQGRRYGSFLGTLSHLIFCFIIEIILLLNVFFWLIVESFVDSNSFLSRNFSYFLWLFIDERLELIILVILVFTYLLICILVFQKSAMPNSFRCLSLLVHL